MKKESVFVIAFCFAVVFFVGLTVASFSYSGNNIQDTYVGGDNITGTINLSLNSEPAGSLLTSSVGNQSIRLVDFLNNNGLILGQDYNCSSTSCSDIYSSSGSAISSISLLNPDDKNIGFKITGSGVEIVSLSLSLSGSSGPSCSPGAEVNFLGNDTSQYMQSRAYVNQTCGSVTKGCYAGSSSNDWVSLEQGQFCEQMNLSVAPAFKVGAHIKQDSGANGDIIMELFDSNWNSKGTCHLSNLTQGVQDSNCVIAAPNPVLQQDYLCISTDGQGYSIDTEDSEPVCGNAGTNFNDFVIDYDVSAQPLEFDSTNIVINESTYQQLTGASFAGAADSYIDQVYNRNCSNAGCIIPFEVFSQNNQNLNITNAAITFRKSGTGTGTSQITDIYQLQKTNSTITSPYLTLELANSGLTIPFSSTAKTLQLYLGGKQLLKSALPIDVTQGFTFDVAPKTIIVGINTLFSLTSSANLSSVAWNFGDGTSNSTPDGNSFHTYLQQGQFNIVVQATSEAGATITKNFTVNVGDAQTAADLLIKRDTGYMDNISSDLNGYDSWIRNAISDKINLSSMNQTLSLAKQEFDSGNNYSDIVNNLLALSIPQGITSGVIGNVPLEIGFNGINPSYVESLSGNNNTLTATQLADIKQNLIDWNTNNYNTNVNYKVISEQTESGLIPVFTYINITANSKNNTNDNYNFLIDYPSQSVLFKQNYNPKNINADSSSATDIPISGSSSLEFLLPGSVDISQIGAYIAPPLSALGVGNNQDITQVPVNTRPSTGIWLYIWLALLFLVLYVALQEWYKRRYESSLFRNKDDLYNLINFIFNSRISGLRDDDIRNKLSGYNWRGEQLSYAFRKIDGKRTGMWEIPIFKFIENRKVKAEIQKRQEQNMNNGRFIKTQY